MKTRTLPPDRRRTTASPSRTPAPSRRHGATPIAKPLMINPPIVKPTTVKSMIAKTVIAKTVIVSGLIVPQTMIRQRTIISPTLIVPVHNGWVTAQLVGARLRPPRGVHTIRRRRAGAVRAGRSWYSLLTAAGSSSSATSAGG